MQTLARIEENRKLKIDIDATDSRFLIIFQEIVKTIMSSKGDRIELILNRVKIESYKLERKNL